MAEQFINAPGPSREEFDTLNGKISNYLGWFNTQYTLTDTTFGFIDTGLKISDYFILSAFLPFDSNIHVRLSNTNGDTGTHRMQWINTTDGSVAKTSGTQKYVVFCVIDRNKVPIITP